MTDVLKLFSGIGVVIDDSIFDTRKILNGILSYIHKKER